MIKYKALLMASALVLASTAHGFVPIDRTVAIVDDDVVLESELRLKVNLLKERMNAKAVDTPDAVLKQQVLEHLITESAQLQMAKRGGLRIREAEVEDALIRFNQQLESKGDTLDTYLQSNDLSQDELREQIRRDLTLNALQKREVNRRINISPQDVDNFLKSKQGKSWSMPRYDVQNLVIANDGQHTKKLTLIQQELNKGRSFADVVKRYSIGANAKNGGRLGWQRADDLPDLFVQQLNRVIKGELTPPFESPAGIHILKLNDSQNTEQAIIQQSKARHILIKSSIVVNDLEAQKVLNQLRTRALNGEPFDDLAREHSEDIGSMLNGGDLGWSAPGLFDPTFEQVMNDTPVGGISEPFESEFGWHIVYIEDRRNQNMTDEVIRNQAANLLRKQRYDDELQLWLQEVRDRAYINVLM